jgi:hypothetical protein
MKWLKRLIDYIIRFVKICALQTLLYPAMYRIFVTNVFNNQINTIFLLLFYINKNSAPWWSHRDRNILEYILNINYNNNNTLCVGFVIKNGSYIHISMHGVNNTSINRNSYFPHLSSEFDEIRYTSSGHCGVEHLCVSYTLAYVRPCLLYGCKWNYTDAHTVRLQDILEVKKILGKLSALRHGIPLVRSCFFL